MAYTRYNKPIGTLGKLMGSGLLIVKITKTCERAGRPKSWEDFPLFVTTQNAKTRHGAEYYYVQPVKNGPSLRVYFNLVPWFHDYGASVTAYVWDNQSDTYKPLWTGTKGGAIVRYLTEGQKQALGKFYDAICATRSYGPITFMFAPRGYGRKKK